MKAHKGVSARSWFYGRSFHDQSFREAEADGARAAGFLELAGAPIDEPLDGPTVAEAEASTDDCPECGADLNDIRAKGQAHFHGDR